MKQLINIKAFESFSLKVHNKLKVIMNYRKSTIYFLDTDDDDEFDELTFEPLSTGKISANFNRVKYIFPSNKDISVTVSVIDYKGKEITSLEENYYITGIKNFQNFLSSVNVEFEIYKNKRVY